MCALYLQKPGLSHCCYDSYSGWCWTVLHVSLFCLAWQQLAVHTNTAPIWVKAENSVVGQRQMWHVFVWCAKFRCVGLTAKWEVKRVFNEVTHVPSGPHGTNHNGITMTHDLWHSQTTIKTVLGLLHQISLVWCSKIEQVKQYWNVSPYQQHAHIGGKHYITISCSDKTPFTENTIKIIIMNKHNIMFLKPLKHINY